MRDPSSACTAVFNLGQGQKFLRMYNPYNDQTTHRSRALCIGTPTKGVNMVPLIAVSLGVIGGLALETKARRYAWSSLAKVAK